MRVKTKSPKNRFDLTPNVMKFIETLRIEMMSERKRILMME